MLGTWYLIAEDDGFSQRGDRCAKMTETLTNGNKTLSSSKDYIEYDVHFKRFDAI